MVFTECGRAFRHKGNLIRHLAVHDPESSTHEKALALKLGRQKKIQFIDGQQVEVLTGDEDEEAVADGEVMIHGGQQYVVLEVSNFIRYKSRRMFKINKFWFGLFNNFQN